MTQHAADADDWVIGIDSGGTFTDLVARHAATGAVRTFKVPSTPARPITAVIEALAQSGVEDEAGRLVHGTTVATNAVLQRRGARLCLVTTAGFEDVPSIQRLNRRYAYRLDWQKPSALVRRRHTVGVDERMDAGGRVVRALDESELERVVERVATLVAEEAIEAVAICLLFSFLNDSHEQALAEALAARLPDVPVSLSSRISPLWREYERVSTTLADAYVRVLMTGYLDGLGDELKRRSVRFPFLILKSNGGTASPDSVRPAPVSTLLSGLAGGVVGGAFFGVAAGESHCITFDMGGTSTDVGVVDDGQVRYVGEYEIEWGLPVVTPVVDVHAIGAGGGSIARLDRGGLMRVGPESAGAVPGPACYGAGGLEATVTDANLVLGRLSPAYFLGGRLRLDADSARVALGDLGSASGMTPEAAALAVVDIANENMADAIRLVTIERGIDPRDYALVAFGGAGPLHACGVADAVGIQRVIVPPHPGLCSAFGAAIAQLRVERVWSLGRRAETLDESALRAHFEDAERDAIVEIERDGLRGDSRVERSVACRYYQQNYEQLVPVTSLDAGFVSAVVERFHELHRTFYGYSFEGEPVEFVHCRVAVNGPDEAHGRETSANARAPAQPREPREVVTGPGLAGTTPVFRRGTLGRTLVGPLIVEEEDSTLFVPAHWTVRDEAAGCLRLERTAGESA